MADLDRLQIPLQDIVKATNKFAHENLIKQGEFAVVYEGQLLRSGQLIDVIVRRIHPSFVKKIVKSRFRKEVQTLADLNHKNIVSIVGFCDENDEMIMIMERAVNGGLDKHLSDPNLTWPQRLKICLGVALALKHIGTMNGGDRHHDIKSSKILLDKDWEPMLFCFGFHINYDVFYKTTVYTDPDFIKTGRSHNSDVYSLGVIMFEVLCGRKADETLLSMVEQGKQQVEDLIDPNLRKQMHPLSLTVFYLAAFSFLNKSWLVTDMNDNVKGISDALEIESIKEILEEKFAYLKIPLGDIMLATKDFSETYLIRSQRDGTLYKAELNHFDHTTLLTTEWKDKSALPKSRSTVFIKRIDDQPYMISTKGLLAKIEMLTSCKNPNIVSLLGFSWEGSEKILIYEGAFTCLHKYLQSTHLIDEGVGKYLPNTYQSTNLTWEQRIHICLDIVHGLKYLFDNIQPGVIHQRIHSENVFLDEKLNAKILLELLQARNVETADELTDTTPLSHFPTRREVDLSTDEEAFYMKEMLRSKSEDIYSIGVILIKMLTGSLDNNLVSKLENIKRGAQQYLNEESLKNSVDPRIMEEVQKNSFFNKKGPNQDSLATFSHVAYKCLADNPSDRPTLEVVIKSLKKALQFQVQKFEHLKIEFHHIEKATGNFDENHIIGSGGYGEVYKGELDHFDISSHLATEMKNKDEIPKKHSTVAIKKIFSRDDNQGNEGFLTELELLSRCKHPNIVSLVGFCAHDREMYLVYELASNGSLDQYLEKTSKETNLTWAQRLKMCIEIAQGLHYLHTTIEDKKRIIHRDIKSANILLGENLEAKIADFGLSRVESENQLGSTINTNVAGTNVYLDPEYNQTGKLKKESDIYSFGVVLFEILSGRLAHDSTYMKENRVYGLAAVARRRFKDGTINEIVDPEIMNETHELCSTLKIGPQKNSLDVFLKVAHQCLAEIQSERPTIEVIIERLEQANDFQVNRKDTYKISLEDIELSKESFSYKNSIAKGEFGMIYNGQVRYKNEHKNVAVKRFKKSESHDQYGLSKEYEVLYKYKHENIIGLFGYCKEMDEEIIVYEDAANRSLDKHLKNSGFSWTQRLKSCIDIAKGLNFLHGGDAQKEDVVIHRDIKSSNILLTEDWKAKICGFEISLTSPINKEIRYVMNDVVGSPGYCDPTYWETGFLTKESDIYSLGIVLFEMLCGRLAYPQNTIDKSQFLDDLVKHHYKLGRLEEIVFEGIEGQIALKSLATFRRIAFQCLHEKREERPTTGEVVLHLQKALKIQQEMEQPITSQEGSSKLPLVASTQISKPRKRTMYTQKEVNSIIAACSAQMEPLFDALRRANIPIPDLQPVIPEQFLDPVNADEENDEDDD